MSHWRWLACGLFLVFVSVSSIRAEETQAQRLMKKLLVPPKIQTEAGFTAKLPVPPGQLHDPLIGKALWVTDVNGDFIGGMRELPDGFIVEIHAQK